MTLDELYAEASVFSQHYWGVPYTGRIELVSRRWSMYNGKFIWMRSELGAIPLIRMCRNRNAGRTHAEVLGTLLHELVHWRLATEGLPHRDIDDEFIAECLRVGAPISRGTSAQRAYMEYVAKRGYEERTGRKYDEGGAVV